VSDGYHPPLEEYLEAIHSLGEEGTPVIQARIAERLHRSAPSVSEMLDRLQADGYVHRSGRRVELTDSGDQVARSVVRKHRLAERLLVDVIGLEWHKAHVEAGRWEHVISDDVEARLVKLLGNPLTCPHGNPIPARSDAGSHEVPARQAMAGPPHVPLSTVEPGASVRLERITEELELDMTSLILLDKHGFRPGASATVLSNDGGSITLQLDGGVISLDGPLCRQLYVTTC
jgi:DtxR family Mn-dependent transcriptional regulator